MRCVVVGAGAAGLSAARLLVDAGHDVVVFDKGRGVGGRMATRRIGVTPGAGDGLSVGEVVAAGGAVVDHGAQFFTVRSDEFAAVVQPSLDSGLVHEWCRGFAGPDVDTVDSRAQTGEAVTPVGDGYPRYAVRGGMTALAKAWASGLDVRDGALVFAVRRGGSAADDPSAAWTVSLDDGRQVAADMVVVTCPLPQAFSLLVAAEIDMPEALWRTDYDRTLALLAVLDGPSAVPDPGGVQGVPGFTFIGDNRAKGVSSVPAVTLHFDADFSLRHWESDRDAVHAAMIDAARPWIGASAILHSQVKRWRFATPQRIWPDRCWVADEGSLVVAGDALGGPRVEGAVLSGRAAAHALVRPG